MPPSTPSYFLLMTGHSNISDALGETDVPKFKKPGGWVRQLSRQISWSITRSNEREAEESFLYLLVDYLLMNKFQIT